jgi:hypothetical protein
LSKGDVTDLEQKLLALDTYTTRYTPYDGRERAVLLMEDYQWLLKLATDLAKAKKGHPEASPARSPSNPCPSNPIVQT